MLRIGACQTPEILGDVDAAVGVVWDFAAQAYAESVDLLLFPECFLQGYLGTERHVRGQALDVDGAEFAAVLRRLARVRPMLVLGMIERAGDACYNTAVLIGEGRVAGRYRKAFLTPGETAFTAGDAYPVFDCGGVPFGINICFDTQFPAAAAAIAAAGAKVLLVPAQNMMRRDKALWWYERHNRIRACRARETGLWLVSADVTGSRDELRTGLGPTCVMDPSGRVVARVPTGTTGLVVAEIDGRWPSVSDRHRLRWSSGAEALVVVGAQERVEDLAGRGCHHGRACSLSAKPDGPAPPGPARPGA
ncbi:carbon-nitrogen hydrolase family protein [Dactylosporangium sp. McL0621]|uniref:carbon-nitrogen hydrolase family protein n=1 Tax=Dactylosporangium sp. McL0621 TaxID=3415678 RepID=UPI003CEFE1C8